MSARPRVLVCCNTMVRNGYIVGEGLERMLIGLRNAGAHCCTLIAHREFERSSDDPGFRLGELTGRRVGLIGLGHIGRRLIELLEPFRCQVVVHDPYAPKEVALAMHV